MSSYLAQLLQLANPAKPAKQEFNAIQRLIHLLSQPSPAQLELDRLQSLVSSLSELVNQQLQLLVEVENDCGRDAYGAPFEDGECKVIDRVRAHLAANSTPTNEQITAKYGCISLHQWSTK